MQNNIIKTNRIDFVGDAEAVEHTLSVSAGALCLDGSPLDTGGTTPAEITLADGHLLVGQATGKAGDKALSGEATIANTGAITLANSAVIGKVITGYSSGAGTVAATDTILQAINKLNGNQVAGVTDAAITGKVLTGYVIGADALVAETDTIMQAIAKLQGQLDAL
jgi:hypothetical protein